MALTPDQLTLARSLSPEDLTLFMRTYQRAHPDDANGPVADQAPLRRVLYRTLRILARRLPQQLAVTPLVHEQDQESADDLADFYGDATVSQWTSTFPDPVLPTNFRVGDIVEALDASYLPGLIVSVAVPGGTEVTQGAIGSTSQDTTTLSVYYVMAYSEDMEAQLKALAAGSAIADIMRTVRQVAGVWGNGKVGQIQVNTPMTAKGARFIVAIVPFSCTAFIGYTPTRQ